MVHFLHSHGADLNIQDACGDVPLIIAAKHGHLDVCEFLVDKGLDINSQNSIGKTPLAAAAENGHYNVCEYFLIGADLNLCDTRGISPLYHLCSTGNVDMVQRFIEAGAAVTDGCLQIALDLYYNEVAKMVLRHTKSIDKVQKRKN